MDEHEDEGIRETGEEGEGEYDGFGQEHLEGPDPSEYDLFERESLFEGSDFIRAVEIGVCAGCATFLRNFVHHDGRAGLGDKDEMGDLDDTAKDELDPDGPSPMEIPLAEATNDRTQD